MFLGCTNLEYGPEIYATNLNISCMYAMFRECTNLKSVPHLPATTLKSNCYRQLFYLCRNLTSISINFTDWAGTNKET